MIWDISQENINATVDELDAVGNVLAERVDDWLMGDVLGIYHTMDNFTGRK